MLRTSRSSPTVCAPITPLWRGTMITVRSPCLSHSRRPGRRCAGQDEYRPLAVLVTDPATGKVIGGLYGASSRGQLRVDRFFLPQELRRDRLGSRLLKMAE